MMSSKSSRKMIKSVRSSPMRKEHMMKKSNRTNSPIRSSGSSRPPPIKRFSSGMKRENSMSSKNFHSSRSRPLASPPHRSVARHNIPSPPAVVDRSRSFKNSKYEKRKDTSISPARLPSPLPISRERRAASPYHDSRYMNPRPIIHEERLEPPAKKKIHREPERFPRAQSPVLLRKSNDIPFISDGSGLSLRSEVTSHPPALPIMSSRGYLNPSTQHDDRMERNFRSHHSPPPISNSQSKRVAAPIKSYDNVSAERYKSDIPGLGFSAESEKGFSLTLNERFSNVETSEPRIRYSREDLEKITIDIRRNLREQSPTLRQIVNPNDVKLVRRANEGHRPIFDREEIKQAPRDMREDAYYEKKSVSSEGMYHQTSSHSRESENYEITRHRFDGQRPPYHASGSRSSLSDRWQNPEVRKESGSLDRDEREREYQKVTKKNFAEVRNRSKSRDRDFRSERYSEEISRSRSDYHNNHRSISSSEQRSQIISHKEPSHPQIHRRLGVKRERVLSPPVRSEARSHFRSPSEKRYSESLSRDKPSERHSPMLVSHKYAVRSRSRSRGRDERSPEFSRRSDKYSYKPYADKRDSLPPTYIPRGKEPSDSYRGRGSRPFRSRGFRSRGFRGLSRGGFRGRISSFRGSPRGFKSSGPPRGYRNANSPRGRGAPRRGRYSPHLWEHDLYRMSPDAK